ncbi:hypothetical protein M0805_006012 [Coniferiporia weirii]|nr:hypothetical protein M0805_006012 [Coniferiporia weirii]
MPKSVPSGAFPGLGPSSGSERSLPAESEVGDNHSKRRRNDDNFDKLCEQGLRYMFGQLSYSQNLRHVFNLSAVDEKLWICYYESDHTGIIRTSQPLDSVNDLPRFVLLLKCMKDIIKGERGGLNQETKNKDHNAAPGLIVQVRSANTASKNANRKGTTPEGPEFVTQFSLSIRGQIFRFIGRLAETRSHGPLGRVSGVSMTRLDQKEAKCKLGNCLPVIHVSEDYDDLAEANICFRQRLYALKFLGDVENRVLRTTASEILIPVYKLDNLENFRKYFRSIFQGHQFLCFESVMHRGISVGNLTCRCVWDELNDWDLSGLKGPKEPTSNSRTGTRPFMARDLFSEELQDHLELQYLERYD